MDKNTAGLAVSGISALSSIGILVYFISSGFAGDLNDRIGRVETRQNDYIEKVDERLSNQITESEKRVSKEISNSEKRLSDLIHHLQKLLVESKKSPAQ